MDHSTMDHSGMDHSMMGVDVHGMDMSGGLSPGPGPSPSPTMAQPNHAHMSHSMTMSMQMWFQATTKVVLWFREWNIGTPGGYAGSIIGLFALCLLQEGISRLRTDIARRYSLKDDTSDAENNAVIHPETAFSPFFGRMYNPLPVRILLSLLYAFNLGVSYLLMLAVMTYNVGYFCTIISGLALGHLVFFPAASKKRVAPPVPANC